MLNIFLNILERWTVRVATCPIFKLFGSEPVTCCLNKGICMDKVAFDTINRNGSSPFETTFSNSPDAGRVIFASTGVPNTTLVGDFSKITPSVIMFYAINMINRIFGTIAIHVKESKAVKSVQFYSKTGNEVSAAVICPDDVTFCESRGSDSSDEVSSFRVVLDELFKKRLGKHVNPPTKVCDKIRSVAGKLSRLTFQGIPLSTLTV